MRTERGYWAFVPHPLPPRMELGWEVAGALAAAERAIGELRGVSAGLPDPAAIATALMAREAVASSRIEGLFATVGDVLLHRADPRLEKGDAGEVSNCLDAMVAGVEALAGMPLSGRFARELHRILMAGVRGGYANPGEYRRSQVWIGPAGCGLADATIVPPPPEELAQALGQWEEYLHGPGREPALVKCALLHYQYEAIHPFLDGNGRVGRLLNTLFLVEQGCLERPSLCLSAYFLCHQREYYARLLAVSREGDWRGWLRYFLRGVEEEARAAVVLARELLAVVAGYRERLGKRKPPKGAVAVLDGILGRPVISVSVVAKETGLPYQSVQNGVGRLVEVGALEEMTGRRRGRLYAPQVVLKLLAGGLRAI